MVREWKRNQLRGSSADLLREGCDKTDTQGNGIAESFVEKDKLGKVRTGRATEMAALICKGKAPTCRETELLGLDKAGQGLVSIVRRWKSRE